MRIGLIFILLLFCQITFGTNYPTTLEVNHCTLQGNESELPIFDRQCEPQSYTFLDPQFHKIHLKSKVNSEYYLRYNYILFEEFKLWVQTDSSLDLVVDMAKNSRPTKYERSLGIPIALNLKKGEEVTVFVMIDNKGFPLDNTFFIYDKATFIEKIDQEQTIKLTSRTIVLSLLFIGCVLGFIIREKLFLYYTISSLTAFLFFESESGFITNLIPHEHFLISKYLLIIASYIYPASTLYFYIALIFNDTNRVPRYLYKVAHVLLGVCLLCALTYFLPFHEVRLFNFILAQLTTVSSLLLFLLFLYVIILGIKYKEKLAIPTLVIFMITNLFVIVFSILPNMGIFDKLEITRNLYFVVFTFDIVYYLLLILKKTSSIIKERNELHLQNQLIQQKYSLAVIKGQEDERNRIGRELHDHVGGNLALINKSDDLSSENIRQIIKHTISSVRNLSHGLVSPEYDFEDFEDIILDLCTKYQSLSLKVYVNYSSTLPIDSSNVKNHCYRITQELLNNAKKHSGASELFLDFLVDDQSRKLTIFYEDNGTGFSLSDVNEGIGLKNIRFRVNALEGDVSFAPQETGTIITISNINIDQ